MDDGISGQEAGAGVALDLYGFPIGEPRGKRGRPSHVPTVENRRIIAGLFAEGHLPQQVADALTISLPTLRKHYGDLVREYLSSALRLKGQMLGVLIEQAQAGNAVAADKVAKRLDRILLPLAPKGSQKRAEPKKGKKEQALEAAAKGAHGGGHWASLLSGGAKAN